MGEIWWDINEREILAFQRAVHMKLISLKQPKGSQFSSRLLHLGEADESAFCCSDFHLLC